MVRAMNQQSCALGFRSQRRSAGTNNNDPWQQSANIVKETKSSCHGKWSHKAPGPGESVDESNA